mmetsp:Transcript_3735/g.23495  ORF Transcript_3735/g.23495 Transcript_3735/m.23495 type:complete len:256 (+) Transcript_3735:352-1119(+)
MKASHLAVLLLALYLGMVQMSWKAAVSRCSRSFPDKEGREVLLVTAHPDDECMFFAPTVLALHDQAIPLHLLCLSRGNFDGMGATRLVELQEAALGLGVAPERTSVVDRPELEDGLRNWEPHVIVEEIATYIQHHPGITDVVTFDEHGISGHKNHRDIYRAARRLHAVRPWLKVWCLRTVPVVQKYLGLTGALWSALSRKKDELLFLSSNKDRAAKCMKLHRSQYVWFRRLYVFFSSYMHANPILSMENEAMVSM